LRKFDREGKYLGVLYPPPANMPESRLEGMGYVEYEPGKRAVHGPNIYESVANRGHIMPKGVDGGRRSVVNCQPVLIGERVYFANPGFVRGVKESRLHFLRADGATEAVGLQGVPLVPPRYSHLAPRLAVSPDGRYVYLTDSHDRDARTASYVVWRRERGGKGTAQPFAGTLRKPGSGNAHLAGPAGLDCDAKGRVYVCDPVNRRVQVFSPEGKHLKKIVIDRPYLIRVHRRTGAIYVLHVGRDKGRSVNLITKLRSFEDPRIEYQQDQWGASVFALDQHSRKPRLWLAGGKVSMGWGNRVGGPSVRIFEEDGKKLKKIVDFDEEARKSAGDAYLGRWAGTGTGGSGVGGKLVCDIVREKAYYGTRIFDLKTGKSPGVFQIRASTFDDFAFDKRGYMHVHFNPGFYLPGVGRVDPDQAVATKERRTGKPAVLYPETPYDYGEARTGKYNTNWKGILPVRDQPGAKFFQDGIGVNMQGEVAVETNIYYVPKMEDTGFNMVVAGMDQRGRREEPQTGDYSFAKFMKSIKEKQKRGEIVHAIRRRPGIPLAGATIWTFEATGELRGESVIAGSLINGVRIDEAGKLYFVSNRSRIRGGKPFLADRTARFGGKGPLHLMSGTLIKAAGKGVKVLQASAAIPLTEPPARPAELMTMGFYNVYGKKQRCWVEGAEWLYAGASPIVQDAACSCPTQRFHLDWFNRSYVPEAYRHSIGVLDSAGNLVMHLGRYGNYDSGQGRKSRIPVGGDGIAMIQARFISGTDTYLAFTDWCERIVVLRLGYHQERAVSIREK
jgi:hypothetical protein